MNPPDASPLIPPGENSRGADVRRLALIALAYLLAFKLSLLFPDAQSVLAAVWPPSGVALAALLLSPRRQRGAILAVIFATGYAVNFLNGRSLGVSAMFAVADAVEPWACVWLITRLCRAKRVTFSWLREVLALALCAFVANGVTALAGTAAVMTVSHAHFNDLYLTWWISDGLGIMVVTPLLVTCAQPWRLFTGGSWPRLLETVVLALAWCVFAWFAFSRAGAGLPVAPEPYWICALLVWAALRFDTRTMAVMLTLLALIAIGFTVTGRSGFPLGGNSPSGHLHMVQLYLSVITLTGLVLAAVMTERSGAEEALRRSDQQFRNFMRHFPGLAFIKDADGRVLFANEGFATLLGLETPAMLGKTNRDLFPPGFAETIDADDRRVLAAGRDEEIEEVFSGRTWTTRKFAITEEGAPPLLGGITHDITARKEAEEALRESEARYRTLIENTLVGIGISAGNEVLYANQALLEIFGYSDEEFRRLTLLDSVTPDSRPVIEDRMRRIADGETLSPEFEFSIRRKDGAIRRLYGMTMSVVWRGRPCRQTIFVDITKRHEAEAELRHSEEKNRSILQTAIDGFWAVDSQGRILEVNESYCRMSGYTAQELTGMRIVDVECREASGDVIAHNQAIMAEGQQRFETQHRRKDGAILEIEVSVQYQPADGGRFVAFLRDITERKRLAATLRESEERYRLLVDSAPEPIVLHQAGRIIFANPAALKLFGATKPEQMLGKPMTDCVHPDFRQRVADRARRALEIGEPLRPLEEKLLLMDGTAIDAEVTGGRLILDGQPTMQVFVRDITQRKRAEAALQASERQFRRIIETMQDGYFRTDRSLRLVMVSPSGARIFGYASPEKMVGMDVGALYRDQPARDGAQSILRKHGKILDYVVEARRKDGTTFWVSLNATFITDDHGQTTGVEGFVRDITERKLAQEALRKSEAHLRSVIAAVPFIIWDLDRTGAILLSEGTALAQLGLKSGELVGQNVFIAFQNEPEALAPIRRGLAGEELEAELQSGGRNWHNRYVPRRDVTGNVCGLVGVSVDITDRVVAQKQLEALLEQHQRDARTKGELLREVNHRVTNNLSSILGLFVSEHKALEPASQPVVKPVLDRLTQRIRGLFTAHRLLSDSAWAPLRVDKLAEKIIGAALSAVPHGSATRITIPPTQAVVSPRQAGNLALILNELTTNSINHGQTAGTPLALSLETGSEDEYLTVCYRDNGPGFPAEILAGTRGNIGLQLIRQLATESLRGQLTLANDSGAVVRLRIRKEEPLRT